MSYTIIPVYYRDYVDSRWYGEIALEGAISADQIESLKSNLLDGALYAPLQLGLSHCGIGETAGFPGINDHGWHTMELDKITIGETPPAYGQPGCADRGGTVADFVDAVRRASVAGWQPLLTA